MDDARATTKKEHPNATIGELGKLMGAAWNKIKEGEKGEKYAKKAAADKERYEKEMAAYKK